MDLPFSNSRAKGGYFLTPGLRIHDLRPEGPSSALHWTSLVDTATLIFQKTTVASCVARRVLQHVMAVMLSAILLRELRKTELKVCGHSFAILKGEVDKSVSTPRGTTLPRSLALKLDAIFVKGFRCLLFCHGPTALISWITIVARSTLMADMALTNAALGVCLFTLTEETKCHAKALCCKGSHFWGVRTKGIQVLKI
jgi:hypothetical protein